MIQSLLLQQDQTLDFNPSQEKIAESINNPKTITWVHLQQPTRQETQTILNDLFHFHPLAIEDCESTGYQTPKVDDFGDYIFIICHAVLVSEHIEEVDSSEVNIFLGANYLVTYCSQPSGWADKVRAYLERDVKILDRGVDFLCHSILDTIVDDYMPIIDTIDEEIDYLEDVVIANPERKIIERILNVKHSLLVFRRIISPQREVINRLSRGDFHQIHKNNRIYFRDVYDHLVRIQDLLESERDIIGGTLDTYLSASSNRLNEVMKALTIVSTIFLPLTFLAGVYGMNFKYFPEINWEYGYFFTWVLFIVIVVMMLWYFKRKGWL